MTFTLEIMLRANETVFSEVIEHAGSPAEWTPADMETVLKKILRTIDRAQDPSSRRDVQLRGLNWIVSPFKDTLVIALEIHSASAVAGPFPGPAAHLERLIVQALSPAAPPQTVH